MTKKRQQDFGKTRMKPGRVVHKRKNATSTAFKAKKITVSRKLSKEKSVLSITESLKRIKSGNPSARSTALNHLNNLLANAKDGFFHHLPELMGSVPRIILDAENTVRDAAINVLDTILDLSSDTQIHTFFPLLTCTLTSAMTHPERKIKESSLKLLGIILRTHPDLIIQSEDILKKLSDLLSNPSQKKTSKPVRTRTLVANYSDSVNSQEWRLEILGLIKIFLKAVVKKKKEVVVDDDNEQEVYWDCEGPLNLIIYSSGGLKPVDIENRNLSSVSSEVFNLEHPDHFQEFLSDFMPLLSAIYIEEIAGDSSAADDDMISQETIQNLNVLFQVLSHLGEWVKLLSNPENELDKFFSSILNENIIRNMRKFPFVPRRPVFDTKIHMHKNKSGVQLNLAVCYLYSAFIIESEYCTPSFKKKIFSYLKSIFQMSFEVRYESIPMLVKITENYLCLNDNSMVEDFAHSILLNMCTMLSTDDKGINKMLLISLFMKLSLDPVYEFMTKDLAMKNWFSVLFVEMGKMVNTCIFDRKLLKDIKKIANRKYSLFLDCLDEIDVTVLKGFLKCENEDVIDTVIFLINNMRHVSNDLLEEISDVILTDPSFPQRMAFRIIRLLTHRFTAVDASPDDRLNFIQFLLNIAMDTVNVGDENWGDYELPEFSKAWSPCKDFAIYDIYPSLHWKKHSKLFKVCCRSLSQFPQAIVNKITMLISKEMMDFSRILPMHSVIATLRLNNFETHERYHECQIQDLIFSSFLFLSVFTTIKADDEWYRWNVVELLDSLELTRKTAVETLRVLEFEPDGVLKEGIVVHYILRILKFFATRKMLQQDDRDRVLALLEKFIKNCKDENMKQQTLFIKLVNFFGYYR